MRLDDVLVIVKTAAGIRSIVPLMPLGGSGAKLMPYTCKVDRGSPYVEDERSVPTADGKGTRDVKCVSLNSKQAEANRFETAIIESVRSKDIDGLPYIALSLASAPESYKNAYALPGLITSLELPHRAADGWFRTALLGGKPFNQTPVYDALAKMTKHSLLPMFVQDPVSLVFGSWFSGSGVGGAKNGRIICSTITGINVKDSKEASSRVDPLIRKGGMVARNKTTGELRLLDKENGEKPGSDEKAVKLSVINVGGIPAATVDQHGKSVNPGVFVEYALQETHVSVQALRNMFFGQADATACRAYLFLLAMAGAVLSRSQGYRLRSWCDLVPYGEDKRWTWQVVAMDGTVSTVVLHPDKIISLLAEAAKNCERKGIAFSAPLILEPTDRFHKALLVREDLFAARSDNSDEDNEGSEDDSSEPSE